ncbi:hypothetical protein Hsw_2477 [Hymenobacter swuensis DY53]|uniref:Uncharacterized protein n=1 Tax=Hymenobacter swuensis DY53 TaxID=1227739 RepID=W8F225_9BACT|nr:hypothetical protein Hsw_2477 [Hymenobacter swuensis DY53]
MGEYLCKNSKWIFLKHSFYNTPMVQRWKDYHGPMSLFMRRLSV